MAPKKSVTKSAIQVGPADATASLDNVPVGDQAKVSKRKGRPTKNLEEVTDVPATAEMEQDTEAVAVDEGEVAENKEKKKSGPGNKSKQKRSGLVFPVIKMRQILKKGKESRRV